MLTSFCFLTFITFLTVEVEVEVKVEVEVVHPWNENLGDCGFLNFEGRS